MIGRRRTSARRAGDRTRTGDVQLGKLAFYQLNYAREVLRANNLPVFFTWQKVVLSPLGERNPSPGAPAFLGRLRLFAFDRNMGTAVPFECLTPELRLSDFPERIKRRDRIEADPA